MRNHVVNFGAIGARWDIQKHKWLRRRLRGMIWRLGEQEAGREESAKEGYGSQH